MNKWHSFLDNLPQSVLERLCECRNTRNDIKILALEHYKVFKCSPGDSIIAILEHLSCNSQFYDLSNEEFETLETYIAKRGANDENR